MCSAKITLSISWYADDERTGGLIPDAVGTGWGVGSGSCYQARILNSSWTVMSMGGTAPCHQAMVQSAANAGYVDLLWRVLKLLGQTDMGK